MQKLSASVEFVFFVILVNICFIFVCSIGSTEIYKYKNKDGVWVFTDTPKELPDEGVNVVDDVKTKLSPGTGVDIGAHLTKQLNPLNTIEKATLGVVSIQTPIGFGTGFFVTDSGYLVTNKHVLRLTEQEKNRRQTVRSQSEDKIKTAEKDMGLEQEKLELFKKQLDEYKKQVSEFTNQKDKAYAQENYSIELKRYQSWQADFKKRKIKFENKLSEYRDQISSENFNESISYLKQNFHIYLADNSKQSARLISVSEQYDLALLKLDGHKTPYLDPVNQSGIYQGQKVYAIGNPAKLKNSVSTGIMSGQEGIFIKTDAKIYPGNSGGPLISSEGRVMGINTFKKLTHKYEGLGFAISMDVVLNEFGSYISR
ncbi:MAG: trypsin-like serine protease [Desulfobacteraceae bacterium]|nr:trypsin-like serine protease [Desulfobacteraceae bacterium]